MAEAEVAQPPTVTEDIPKEEHQVANNVSPTDASPKADGMVNGEEETKVEGVCNDTAPENEVVENGEKEENKKEDTIAETGSPKAKKDKKPSKIANFLRKFSCTSGDPDENINPDSKPIEKNNHTDSKPKVNGEEKKKKDKKKNVDKKEDEKDSDAGEDKNDEEATKDNIVTNDEVKVVITEAEEVKVNGEIDADEAVVETEEVAKETSPVVVNGETTETVEEEPTANGVSEDIEVKIIEEVVIVPKMEGLNIESKEEAEGSAVVEETVLEHREPPSEAPPPIPEGEVAAVTDDVATEKSSTEKAAPTQESISAEENK